MVKLKPEQTRGRGPWYQAAEEHTLVAMVIKQFVALSGPLALAKGKWDEAPDPGKNHALSWFMIAVKTSEFSPRRVNKHHSAGWAICVLMCKDPTSLFDTLLGFSS